MYVIRNNLKHPSTIFENAVFKVDAMMLGLKKKKLSRKFKKV